MDRPSMPLNYVMRDPEAQPRALFVLGRKKCFKDSSFVLDKNSRTGVGDGNTNTLHGRVRPVMRRVQVDRQRASRRAHRLHRVDNQVRKYLS